MRWYANELGYGDEADFWATVGLLHDLDFEQWPEQHCQKCQELMRDADVDERTIHAVASHGYGICCDIAPEHEMEKVLFAADELTGLIWAAALMRPSKSTTDMELKSVKKEVQGQEVRRRMQPRRHHARRGAARLGAGYADRANARRDAGHRGRRHRKDRRIRISAQKAAISGSLLIFSLGSTAQFGKQIWREFFSSDQGLESAGILYVFQTFKPQRLAEKGNRQSALTQLCGVAFIFCGQTARASHMARH